MIGEPVCGVGEHRCWLVDERHLIELRSCSIAVGIHAIFELRELDHVARTALACDQSRDLVCRTILLRQRRLGVLLGAHPPFKVDRSEEHTSELQSLMRHSYAVYCLQKK